MIRKSELKSLYKASDIQYVWDSSKNIASIEHPQHGLITPNQYRAKSKGQPCPYCGQKMVHGKDIHSTNSQKEAIERGYQYINKDGKKAINQTKDGVFFHPNYVTLDHKLNKARCPEKMFDYDNLEAVCWQCNQEKGDDNSFELKHNQNYLDSLADEALARYPTL